MCDRLESEGTHRSWFQVHTARENDDHTPFLGGRSINGSSSPRLVPRCFVLLCFAFFSPWPPFRTNHGHGNVDLPERHVKEGGAAAEPRGPREAGGRDSRVRRPKGKVTGHGRADVNAENLASYSFYFTHTYTIPYTV